jgi:hypothetical protein
VRKITFRPKERLDFPCYKYRWQLFLQKHFIGSAKRLKYLKEIILTEFKDWECPHIEANLKVVALCKKKGTGEIVKVEYEIFCEEEEKKNELQR